MKRCMLINTTSILPKDIDMLHLQFKSLSRHNKISESPIWYLMPYRASLFNFVGLIWSQLILVYIHSGDVWNPCLPGRFPPYIPKKPFMRGINMLTATKIKKAQPSDKSILFGDGNSLRLVVYLPGEKA